MVNESIWISDKDGKVLWYNEQWKKVNGFPDDHIVQVRDWGDFTDVVDINFMIQDFYGKINKGRYWETTFQIKFDKKNTRWFHSTVHPITDANGNLYRWIGFISDITNLKDIEEKLRISEGRYQLASLASRDVIWDWDLRTNRCNWNHAIDLTFKHHLVSFETDITWWDGMIHPEDRKRVSKGIRESIVKKEVEWREEYRFKRGDGSYAFVRDIGYIFFDKKMQPIRMIGVLRDISIEKNYVERLKEAKSIAEEANFTQTNFISNMSHEVRTPLSSILGSVELLRRNDLSQSELESYCNIIERNSQKILTLFNDILNLNVVQSGKLNVAREVVNTEELLSFLENEFLPEANRKGLKFKIVKMESVPHFLELDKNIVLRIIGNVVDNALKFTNQGRIKLGFDYKDPYLIVEVSDTGIGITTDSESIIFRPFRKVDESDSRKYPGSGVGLALSKQLARKLHGDVILKESSPGGGSTFQIFIKTSITRKLEKKEGIYSYLGGKRVLIIDPHKETRLMGQAVFSRLNARVNVSSDIKDALNIVEENQFDFAFIPYLEKDEDIHALVKEIKSKNNNAKIIALTYGDEFEELNSNINYDGSVKKPFDIRNVINFLDTLNL